jgi:CYTH domain-containing protein
MALEIEKRLLLKRLPLPTAAFKEAHHINQYYGPTGRLRHVEIFKDGKKSPVEKFIRTNKKTISPGVNEEIESEITKKDFYKELKKCTKHLFKTRYIKKIGNYKWELDVFDFKMVIAEVEVKTKRELKTVPIPKFIKDVLILDITGVKPFSNFNLADKWKFKI